MRSWAIRSRMELVAAAVLAGLLATPHCVAMCGGFASACSRSSAGGIAWHAGRLTTYASLGAVAAAIGMFMPGPAWLPALLSSALLVWFVLSLAGVSHPPAPKLPGLRYASRLLAQPRPVARFGFGMINGLLPCGMLYAALALAIAAAHPLYGALTMLAFGVATVPGLALLSLSLQRFALRGAWQRRAIAILVLAAGVWSIAARATSTAPIHVHQQHGRAPAALPQ